MMVFLFFQKKKINSIKVNQKKVNNAEISKSFTSVVMPRKNPIRGNFIQQKKLEDGEKISELVKKNKEKNIIVKFTRLFFR